MQYRITTPDPIDLPTVQHALRDIDPAAVVDLPHGRGTLRISTWATPADVLSVLASAGLAVAGDQIEQLPSECCGGCGG